MSYKGGCHCGKIAFDVDGDIDKVVECNCSICSKRGSLFWFVPRTNLHLCVPASELPTYTFNKHHIQHKFCPVCGVSPFSMATDRNGNEMAAMNVRCFEGVDTASLKVVPFDGRSL